MEDHVDVTRVQSPQFEPAEWRVFSLALSALQAARVATLVGGAFAKYSYTGIWRNTKDLDIFLKPEDLRAALDALAEQGFVTSVEYEHWLAKAKQDPYFVDLIFGTGHGHLQVTKEWFEHSKQAEIAGLVVQLVPIEELIVSKIYIAERYRFDGADVLHLVKSAKGELDWQHVVDLLGENRGLLLWHLMLFDFVYPGLAHYLPQQLMTELFEEVKQRWTYPTGPCEFRGSLIDPFSFTVDMLDWGFEDRRETGPLVTKQGDIL